MASFLDSLNLDLLQDLLAPPGQGDAAVKGIVPIGGVVEVFQGDVVVQEEKPLCRQALDGGGGLLPGAFRVFQVHRRLPVEGRRDGEEGRFPQAPQQRQLRLRQQQAAASPAASAVFTAHDRSPFPFRLPQWFRRPQRRPRCKIPPPGPALPLFGAGQTRRGPALRTPGRFPPPVPLGGSGFWLPRAGENPNPLWQSSSAPPPGSPGRRGRFPALR